MSKKRRERFQMHTNPVLRDSIPLSEHPQTSSVKWKVLPLVIAIVLVFTFGVLARTFHLWKFWFIGSSSLQQQAESIVREKVEREVEAMIKEENPGLKPDAMLKAVKIQTRAVIAAEKTRFASTVKDVRKVLEMDVSRARSHRHYLLESDPYYYYDLTKRLLRDGELSDQFRRGKFFNSMRLAPNGTWDPNTLHPYVGCLWYRFLRLIYPVELMSALCVVPLMLFLATIIVFFLLGRLLGATLFSVTSGAAVLALSPFFIQRSAYGWYDTDPYNYLFPLLVLTLYLFGFIRRRSWIYAFLAGFFTAFYLLFWTGWQYLLGVMAVAGIVGIAASWFLERQESRRRLRDFLVYIIAVLGTSCLFLTPQGFRESFSAQLAILPQVKGETIVSTLWPNCFFAVSELAKPSFRKVVFLTSNPMTWMVAATGLSVFYFRGKKGKRNLPILIFLLAFFLPQLMLAFQVERFSVFLAVPIALFAMLGVESINTFLNGIPCSTAGSNLFFLRIRKPLVTFFCSVWFVFLLYHGAAGASIDKSIVNDTWYDALDFLKHNTSHDAIVDSWWGAGYFVNAIAERKSVLDGGTLTLPENHFMAKALMMPDEREAAAIFRMLATTGLKAIYDLTAKGYEMADAYDIVMTLIKENKVEAASEVKIRMSSKLSEADQAHLLKLTHRSEAPPPVYVFIYNNLIITNLEVSTLARWNLRRAEALQLFGKMANRTLSFDEYIGLMLERDWKSEPEAAFLGRRGDAVLFQSGLLVDLQTKSADRQSSDGSSKTFYNLFYMENEKFVEQKNQNSDPIASALLIENEGNYTSVLGDSNLIRSLLFRLYYLRGEGLEFFKPFYQKDDPGTGTSIYIFKIDWTAFDRTYLGDVPAEEFNHVRDR